MSDGNAKQVNTNLIPENGFSACNKSPCSSSPQPPAHRPRSVERAQEMRPAPRRGPCSRHRGPIFLICLFLVFLQAGMFADRQKHEWLEFAPFERHWFRTVVTSASESTLTEHPITKLMAEAELSFRKKLARQSQTLKAAVKEYKRRYRRNPPVGFDKWWEFAQQNNVKLVDEYDGIVEDLAPFWSISGEEFRRRALQVGYLPSIDLVRVRNGKSKTLNIHKGFRDSEVSARANGFRQLIERFEHALPDMDFPINAKAEGRILVPWEHSKFPNSTRQDSSAGIELMLGGPFHADWAGTGNVWEAYRRTCDPHSEARRLLSAFRHNLPTQSTHSFRSGEDFRFSAQTEAYFDFCQHPWARYTQGHFFSDWRTIPALYPVLSPAKALGFMDIRIPSHYYSRSTQRYTYGWDPVNLDQKDVDDMEVPWANKSSTIFWRGSTTGGGSHPPGFSHVYHRHRFLKMANDRSSNRRTIVFADPPASSRYVSVDVPANALNEELMDAAFVKAINPDNYPGGLEAMLQDMQLGDAVPLGTHWSYKYLLDLDGMSYSARFLAFLASDSVPIKSTVYREFYSDWIQPWLHFIPLSSSYKEIYNIHAYFSGPPNVALQAANVSSAYKPPDDMPSPGDRKLRRIARAGKQWKQTIGRVVDMEVYAYRLCLEYARLWADDRSLMDFELS